jgi:hypothetical protein
VFGDSSNRPGWAATSAVTACTARHSTAGSDSTRQQQKKHQTSCLTILAHNFAWQWLDSHKCRHSLHSTAHRSTARQKVHVSAGDETTDIQHSLHAASLLSSGWAATSAVTACRAQHSTAQQEVTVHNSSKPHPTHKMWFNTPCCTSCGRIAEAARGFRQRQQRVIRAGTDTTTCVVLSVGLLEPAPLPFRLQAPTWLSNHTLLSLLTIRNARTGTPTWLQHQPNTSVTASLVPS